MQGGARRRLNSMATQIVMHSSGRQPLLGLLGLLGWMGHIPRRKWGDNSVSQHGEDTRLICSQKGRDRSVLWPRAQRPMGRPPGTVQSVKSTQA